MSKPITVDKIINKLPSRFLPENAEGINAVFQFELDDDSDFYIQINDGLCQVEKGLHDDPNLTLITDAETMIGVVSGDIDGMSAFMKGRLRAEGNVILATKLGKLFSREKRK
ncbi:SCP2 sterol-binding domain-containing protein [Marinobacterium arenosum]|uniref:SCP2 sterol-binding domain-containing protein n=1 Tax=Marinobacterium arenosum TaxID=2862496 RepID=UPI001C95E205|nr:SCP2 sterol-binding domain-containing protein [Marinobacterium arenosum]MBY4677260.1 SCP2 sterol-binding domain-containing protein [Marinobacterium arenosum]